VTSPATSDRWRLQARGPEDAPEAWGDIDAWSHDEHWEMNAKDAMDSPPCSFGAGTSLRVVSPEGEVWQGVHIVAVDGAARRPMLPAKMFAYGVELEHRLSIERDPAAWWASTSLFDRKRAFHGFGARPLLRLVGGIAPRGSALRRDTVRASLSVADLVLDSWESMYPGSDQPRRALDVVDLWCNGMASEREVQEAGLASWMAFEGVGKDKDGKYIAIPSSIPRAIACVAALVSAADGDHGGYWGAGTGGWSLLEGGYHDLSHCAANTAMNAFAFAAWSLEEGRPDYSVEEFYPLCTDIVREHIPLREVLVALVDPRHAP
jgi:hypothetical protein